MNKPQQNNLPRVRQQLLGKEAPETECGTIKSIDELRMHFQTAIEIEHSTIPPYLTTLYSIAPASNTFACQTIQGVVMEEMLHMTLAANILNAIGGHPVVDKKEFIPEYPTYLPHSDDAFLVPLQKFSPQTLDVFLKIEKPAKQAAPPQPNDYKTIGQFYHALKHALRYLNYATPGGIFTGDKSLQVTSEHYYGSGGKLIPICSLQSAILAINEIIGQGEGIDDTKYDPDHVFFGEEIEYAHYFRFNEIRHGRRYRPQDPEDGPPTGSKVDLDWNAVLNMKPNPKMANYPVGSPLYDKTREFNRTYMDLLATLQQAFNGRPELLMKSVPTMYELKYKALNLMNVPLGNGEMAGPSFEYIKPA